MEKRKTIIFWLTIILICFAGVFLYSNLLMLYGRLAERESKECVSVTAMQNWEDTLELARAVCVDGQQNHLEQIKLNYNNTMEVCQAEAKKWKDNYFWLQKQNKLEELSDSIIYKK